MKKLMMLLLALSMMMGCALADDAALAPLPMDFSAGYVADPANYSEDGSSYTDPTITVTVEHVWVGNARFNVARVKITDPSQMRIGLAAPFGSTRTRKVSEIAAKSNAIVAIGGDYFSNNEGGYVIRMGEVYRRKPFASRDMLVTDIHGDFHIIPSENIAAVVQDIKENEDKIVNIFNFGPALVIDGVLQEMPEKSIGNIHELEPRCAIGQLGELEYMLVMVDGRGAADSEGCTVATMAQFMFDQGCTQAYNLDGGNSALMVFGGENFSSKKVENERDISDIIYFSTLIPSDTAEAGE